MEKYSNNEKLNMKDGIIRKPGLNRENIDFIALKLNELKHEMDLEFKGDSASTLPITGNYQGQ